MSGNLSLRLNSLLLADSRFVDADGELVKSAVVDRAWRTDRELVALGNHVAGTIPGSARQGREASEAGIRLRSGQLRRDKLPRTTPGLDKQKSLLCQLLDKNMLYVNASDLDDAEFAIPDEDKTLTREFLGQLGGCNYADPTQN